jgi:hypothetical protein
MRLAVSVVMGAWVATAAGPPYFAVLSETPGAWPRILASIGLQHRPANVAGVFVARGGAAASPEWLGRVERGAILILEGESSLAELFGFHRAKNRDNVKISSLTDIHRPNLPIVWEHALESPVFEIPAEAKVFARDRWTGTAVEVGLRRGSGAVLWIIAPPGELGYERFPYLLQALVDLGLEPPLVSARLWAFFDSAYRSRVDLDYFAERWQKAGIAALHVAAWHFYEVDHGGDAYLKTLIESCHRRGILVYAWLELPHVSEEFWRDHPQWREKTGVLQDAQLDWRKLMNLSNRECFQAVAKGVRDLVERFDWDGINLAELYFESLEGIGNPSRFTPMNDDVRSEFRRIGGFDPIELFSVRRDAESKRRFLEYRADLALRMEREWLQEVGKLRRSKPDLDVVLTQVDDQFDPGMRDAIGANARAVLPLLESQQFTFLIEDPATVWNLGAERYRAIAERYRALTKQTDELAMDINIVDRYQDVYPTKQQTGTELFELVHNAAANFRRVAVYFEKSLLPPDLGLLPFAAAGEGRIETEERKIVVEIPSPVGLRWRGPATVDGQAWPAQDDATIWLPAGRHIVQPGKARKGVRLLRLNGDLLGARSVGSDAIEFSYRSGARAIAILDRLPKRVRVDGMEKGTLSNVLLLPRGQHAVTVISKEGLSDNRR